MLVAGCDALLGIGAGPQTPRPCEDVYPAARCDAMLTFAAEQLGLADGDISAIEIAPDPTPRADGGIDPRGGGRQVVVRVHTSRGLREVPMCVGVAMGPPCTDAPTLTIGTPLDAGYHDVPCEGEAPAGCATPLPTLQPDAAAAARPLVIDRRAIPVPGPGHHEIVLGQAAIPNGVLTESRATLADPWPEGMSVGREGIRLEVRPLVPGRPEFRNIYEHGWWPGTEEVEVVLVFEARRVDPGATIELLDVVVR